MTDMPACATVNPRIDELLDGELPPAEADACSRHIETCAACTATLARARALRAALAAMPVPGPRPGFAAEALAHARRRHIGLVAAGPAQQPAAGRYRRRPRRAAWWGGLAAAATAAAVAVLLWSGAPNGLPEATPAAADFTLALYEPREIAIAIDAERALAGARLTVRVEGGIELVGFPETRELSWETDLAPGTNMLALPVLAHSLEQGRLTALVEHEARRQHIELTLQGTTTPAAGQP